MNTSPKIFLLVVVFASFAVTAYGLNCYFCESLSGSGEQNCLDEYEGVSSHVRDCRPGDAPVLTATTSTSVNPSIQKVLGQFAAGTEKASKATTVPACFKLKGKNKDLSYVLRGCTYAYPEGSGETCETREENGVEGTLCHCFGDNCNSASSVTIQILLFLTTLTAIILF